MCKPFCMYINFSKWKVCMCVYSFDTQHLIDAGYSTCTYRQHLSIDFRWLIYVRISFRWRRCFVPVKCITCVSIMLILAMYQFVCQWNQDIISDNKETNTKNKKNIFWKEFRVTFTTGAHHGLFEPGLPYSRTETIL